MTMADPHGDPREPRAAKAPTRTLQVPLRPTDDPQLTCIVCGQAWVEFEFFSRSAGTRQFQGLHARCAETIGPLT
jgi:hypothetical protein